MKKFSRRTKQKTDYRQRLTLLRSGKTRVAIRVSNSNVRIQFIKYESTGDKTTIDVTSRNIEKLGWKGSKNSIPCAYLVGLLAGKEALKKNEKEAVLDIGLAKAHKGSVVFSAAKGVVDSGVSMPLGDVAPSKERIKGAHIADYARKLKSNEALYKKQFSLLLKNGLVPENMEKHFEEIKAKI